MSHRTSKDDASPAMLTVCQAAEILGVGRTLAYALIKADAWPTPVVRVGRLIKIPAAPLRQLVSTGSSVRIDVA